MNGKYREVIYPGSFDPVTFGHLDIVQRAGKVGDKIIIGAGQNPDKKYMFSFPERVEMMKGALKHELYNNLSIDIEAFSGLLVDFAFEKGVDTVVRGIRGQSDLESEALLHRAGESQKNGIETIYMIAKKDQIHISSSVAKAMLKEQGNTETFLPLNVKQFLEARMLGQYIAGVTGSIGTGKSHITKELVAVGQKYHIPVHNIDLDKIGHRILHEAGDQGYKNVRTKIIKTFGPTVRDEQGGINRKALGEIVFNDPEKRKQLDALMLPAMNVKIRKEMTGKKGVLLLNGALLAEADMLGLVNNNILLLDAGTDYQTARLRDRGHDDDQIRARINSQYSTDQKEKIITEAQQRTGHGTTVPLVNNDAGDETIEKAFFEMIKVIDVFGELRIRSVFEGLRKGANWLEFYSDVKKYYDGADRHYHNWFHIVELINQLYDIKNLLSKDQFLALFFAILFHDAIYNGKAAKGQNEADSAALARRKLVAIGAPEQLIVEVERLIMITANHQAAEGDILGQYIADMDKSILGAPRKLYSNYATNIRKEYSMYDDTQYHGGRKAFLTETSEKDNFYTPYYKENYGPNAKKNMQLELTMLDDFAQRNNTVLFRSAREVVNPTINPYK